MLLKLHMHIMSAEHVNSIFQWHHMSRLLTQANLQSVEHHSAASTGRKSLLQSLAHGIHIWSMYLGYKIKLCVTAS